MTLEEQLQDAYQRAAERAPVSTGAYDRFLRRRARRGRVVAATAGLALVAVLGAAVLVARQLPQERGPVAPAGEVVRVPEQGFELPVPAGWRVQRQLTGPGSQGVGVVLVPRSEELRGAAITVVADDDQPPHYILNLQIGARRRADGRLYKQRPAPNPGPGPRLGKGAVGRYVIAWPAWPPACRPLPVPAGQPPACARAAWRVLLVSGAAAPGDTASRCWRPGRPPACEQVARVMRRILDTVRPIGDALPPPGGPPTMVPLGKGGSGAAAWEAGHVCLLAHSHKRDFPAVTRVRRGSADPIGSRDRSRSSPGEEAGLATTSETDSSPRLTSRRHQTLILVAELPANRSCREHVAVDVHVVVLRILPDGLDQLLAHARDAAAGTVGALEGTGEQRDHHRPGNRG